ncbi:MAG TPA: chemotaxis protein CheR [Sedimenticola thiotaurini]|uniref:Chemotaxis protein methyltransferase n=1 Tax=Sedimenticola thiotaurini TaxID=1543721 RepID=A0A831RK51_9GAMM|nr:chemotaxis protein CheR [Sedimenticola thiotaurini]
MQQKVREFPFTRRDFDYLRKVSNERTGIVVGDDKFDMFYSRLSRRVRRLGLRSFAEYCDLIRNETRDDEVLELVNAITTNLTAFFRENHHFDYLAATVLPELMRRNAATRRIRIWSAGCSTGEEPYSLAITLRENLPQGWDGRILATDIDTSVLERAAAAVYPVERVKGIPMTRLKRWFLRGRNTRSGMVRPKPEIRRLVRFEQLNLMQPWSLEEPMDVIFCRNVIIYFDKETKRRLVDRYADSLHPHGYLFIGHSESLFKLTDRFQLIGNTVYRRQE